MTGVSRRKVIAGLGVSLGLTICAPSAFASASIRVPDRPMRLTRRLERGLRDGAKIHVERHWQIEFAAQGRGFAIVGEQLSAAVDAPAKLAAIARIEEARSTDDMWPILISGNGRIIAAGEETNSEDVAAAVREAEAIIAQRSGKHLGKAQHQEYLAQIQRAGTSLIDRLPPDLFFPVGGEHRMVRPVTLPGGLAGEFVVEYSAQNAEGQPWLERAERRFVTRIGEDERLSSDIWNLNEL